MKGGCVFACLGEFIHSYELLVHFFCRYISLIRTKQHTNYGNQPQH